MSVIEKATESAQTDTSLRIVAAAVLLPQLGILGPGELDRPGNGLVIDFRARLGRKNLRYNTGATLLALAAVEELFHRAGSPQSCVRDGWALVAASCYGNLSATCGVAEQLHRGGVTRISPMDLPNASSNVIASQIAIRNGIKGVCLTVDDGPSSGEAVLRWAARLLRSGRCTRVIAVASECPSEYEMMLRGGLPLITGSIAVMLELDEAALRPSPRPASLPAWTTGFELASLGGLLKFLRSSGISA
jgi:3-oxoacyl-[acyl-carrier-protein] synthase II